jgi:hypothetical protein
MGDHPITFEIRKNPIVYGGGHTFNRQNMTRGVAYVQDGYFVCMYAYATGLRGISPGVCFTEKAQGKLEDWASLTFDAQHLIEMALLPGQCFKLLWRPGIDGYEPVMRYLVPDKAVISEAGVALSLLLSRFDDVAQFIQPDARNLEVFSHQLRELLILASTEVETSFRGVLAASDRTITHETRLTTTDFYRLCDPLFLREFSLELRHYPTLPKIRPFHGWDGKKPTKSLAWYDAYNAVKHDRANALHRATMKHCIEALAAASAVYCAQYSIPITGDWMHEPGFELNDWFKIELIDPDPATFYIPQVHVPSTQTPQLWMFDGRNTGSWVSSDLKI